jgi:hypothetical protein
MKLLIAFALALTTVGTLGGCVVVPWGYHDHYYRGDRYYHHGDGYYRDGYYRDGYREHG